MFQQLDESTRDFGLQAVRANCRRLISFKNEAGPRENTPQTLDGSLVGRASGLRNIEVDVMVVTVLRLYFKVSGLR